MMKNACFHLNRKLWVTMLFALFLALPGFAQKIAVHGTVVDEGGEPLIGATVMEKGTTNGTSTDFDGRFELIVPSDGVLAVSYIGYDAQDVPVEGRTQITIVLKENATALADVVVIGYGSVKKSDATGSVAMVMPDEIEANLATSAQDLLVGAAPGVVVTSSGGSPEGGATIRIRGGSSLTATNNPLIVLDGVPISDENINGMANPLAMIAPDNIESMTILKDASATAIYGSRASNGVIIITTKKGKSGRPQVNFSANMTVNHDRKRLSVLSASEFAGMVRDHFGAESEAAHALGTASTDWQKEILRTTISQEYNLSVGGTAGWLPYRVSGSYTNNNGILKNSQMQRVTAGFNLTPEFFGGLLKINANVKGYYIRNRFTNEDCVGLAVGADPTSPVNTYWASGNPDFPYFYNGYSASVSNGYDFNVQGSLNAVAAANDKDNIANIYRSNGNLQIDYAMHFLPDLHANLNLGYDVTKAENDIHTAQNSPSAWNEAYKDGAGLFYKSYDLRRNTLLDFYLNYKKDVEEIMSAFDVMAGYSWQRFDSHGWNSNTVIETPGFFFPSQSNGILTIDPATEAHVGNAYQDKPVYRWNTGRLQLLSFFGRLNYSFKDTYLLTFTLRGDGTSRFSKDNRWGVFPSVALAWKINNMEFFDGLRPNMNEFKLRLGWGQTGQQSVGGYFDYMPMYQASLMESFYPNVYDGYYKDGVTYYPLGYNPDLKWETTTTWNVGLDMGWWNNRLTVALDWYLRDSKDLLSKVTVAPGSSTTNELVQNVGSLRNIGLEATIGAKPVVTQDLVWNTSFNVAWNRNKITKLNQSDDPDFFLPVSVIGGIGNTCAAHMVGHPAYSFYLHEQIYDQNGNPIEGAFVDQNGDGVINANDRVIKHSADPKVTMSWSNNISYKNWDFGISLRASIGNYVYNAVRCERTNKKLMYSNATLRNMLKEDFYFEDQYWFSDYFLENAGYVRCDNITVGYTFPHLLNDNLRLRLYGAVQNPFVITKYKGIDPEIAPSNDSAGVDNNIYPRPVSYTIGLIATF